MPAKKQKLYVEASAIAEPRMSGIGHAILSTLQALSNNQAFTEQYEIVLLAPRDMCKNLERWNFPATVRIQPIWLEKHVLQVLLKYGLLPPMDIFIGRGLYLFPNYKNWPLLFSKSLTYIYDVAYAIFPETIQPKNLKMLQRNLPRWARRTDKIVTISKTSKQEIQEQLNVPSGKVTISYCGVDTGEFFPRSEADIKKVQSMYKLPKDYILFVSSIEPRKNIIRLLDAYANLPAELYNKHPLVLIGGDGWLNEAVLNRIDELQKAGYTIVRPTKYVEDTDLPVVMSGARMLVHPAVHEGFGLAPLQAMACGTPVAVSDIGAVREVVGDAGKYFDPRSTEAITDTMKVLLEQVGTTKKLIAAGMQQAKKFTWEASAEQLIAAIHSVTTR